MKNYDNVCKDIEKYVGGRDNIVGVAHCATRLRIVLKDNKLANMSQLENIQDVKGAFVAGNQLQLIFGAGLVNDVYDAFASYTGFTNMSLSELKEESAKRGNIFQGIIKALSDVFIQIMPAILAAALLMGITGVLGNVDMVKNNDTLFAINKLASLASSGIFAILPMAVCYSAVKRFGGNPVLGMVVGAIMLDGSLTNAYEAAKGAKVLTLHLFTLPVEMIGFQGGIIIALMIGFVVASLDKFFNKKVPNSIKLLLSPLLTVFISTVLLFTIVGPLGRVLSNGITDGLLWATKNLGFVGYALFAGVQQLLVITGLHHIIGGIEAQLIASTGTNFINPLMSVALMGQGGAVIGYLATHWKDVKTRELCLPSFASTLFGISEPAIFGVNLRYRYPLICGCLGGAVSGAYVYFAKLTSLGFGTTAVPGITICNPANSGYINYIIAHLIGFTIGCILTIGYAIVKKDTTFTSSSKISLDAPVEGKIANISSSSDPVFSNKTMGDGVVIFPSNSEVKAPCDGKIAFIYPGGHAIGLELNDGSAILIHCGLDTVNLKGKGFKVEVKEDELVKKGQTLLHFDKDYIEKEGYSTEVLMVVTDCPNKEVTTNTTNPIITIQ
jgi:PTS system sucrose-specific IIC component